MADTRTDLDDLTEREQEILTCLAEGLSNQEIANRLHLALRTVKWYNSQLYSKLGVGSREEAVEKAQGLGLLARLPDAEALEGKHNLPIQTTPFVGRQQELADMKVLLAKPDVRLLTILAPGGMGKTRLSIEAARSQIGRYDDGVFFVPLAPLNSPNDIVSAIAEQVGFSFYGGDPPEQQLLAFLQSRAILLVLDNFEHVLEGAALVTDIIQVAAGTKVLATSRERLNLSGETVFTLSGLHFPTWETPEDALEYDAVQLFLQSARQVRPDFQLQPNDPDHLARICRLTAGMPLGIVLAAAWVDLLGLDQIAVEIQQGIDILETDLRDVPERQQSLRATFNYSWNRLSVAERDVFMKLSVFRGGFTAEAAQAVAGANLRQLRKLADKALLQVLDEGRYDIHELLRQYAAEQLTQADKTLNTARRHLDYYLKLAEDAEVHNFGRQQITWFDRLEVEIDNHRSALAFAEAGDGAEKGLRLAATLATFWTVRGHFIEGANWLERLLAVNQDAPAKHRAYALTGLSRLVGHIGDGHTGQMRGEEALSLAQSINDPWLIAWSLSNLGFFTNLALSPNRAAEAPEESLSLFRKLDDPHGLNNALRRRAAIAIGQAAYPYARELLEEALRDAEQAGHPFGMAQSHNLLGTLAWQENKDPIQTRRHYEASIYHYAKGGGKVVAIYVCNALAALELEVANNVRAQFLFQQALYVAREAGYLNLASVDHSLMGLGDLALKAGNHERAATLLAASEAGASQSALRLEWVFIETYDSVVAAVRNQLGEQVFAEAWATGKMMTLEQAVDFALGPDFVPDNSIFTQLSDQA